MCVFFGGFLYSCFKVLMFFSFLFLRFLISLFVFLFEVFLSDCFVKPLWDDGFVSQNLLWLCLLNGILGVFLVIF